MVERQGRARVQKSVAAQQRLQQCKRHRGVCSSATEVAIVHEAQRCFQQRSGSRGSFSIKRVLD